MYYHNPAFKVAETGQARDWSTERNANLEVMKGVWCICVTLFFFVTLRVMKNVALNPASCSLH